MEKEGDKLIQKLQQAAKRRDDIGLFVFALLYNPPWWYWQEYVRSNAN